MFPLLNLKKCVMIITTKMAFVVLHGSSKALIFVGKPRFKIHRSPSENQR